MSDAHPDARTAILQLLGSGPVAYYPALAAIAGGVTAGVFLAQLFYWHDKGADPAGWIYKTQAEWQAETGLTRWEQETARRRLRERGLLEEKRGGIPARLYYRLDVARVIELLADRSTAHHAVAHQDAAAPRSSMQKPYNQGCGNPANKHVAIPQTSVQEPHRHAETTREHSREKGSENTSAAGSQQVMCSIHGQPMKLRRKDGDAWYSHRLPDGTWCKGAPSDDPGGKLDPFSWASRREYATQFGWEVSRVPPGAPQPTRSSRSERSATPTHPDTHRHRELVPRHEGLHPEARGTREAISPPASAATPPPGTQPALSSRSEGSATPTHPDTHRHRELVPRHEGRSEAISPLASAATPPHPAHHPHQVMPREVRGRAADPAAFRDAGHARGPPTWKGWAGLVSPGRTGLKSRRWVGRRGVVEYPAPPVHGGAETCGAPIAPASMVRQGPSTGLPLSLGMHSPQGARAGLGSTGLRSRCWVGRRGVVGYPAPPVHGGAETRGACRR